MSAYILWGFITIYWKALKAFTPLELIGFRIVMSAILLISVLVVRQRFIKLLHLLRQERLWGRVTLAALVMGMLACFGIGATAGAQLASGFVDGPSKRSAHQIEVRAVGDGLSLSFDAARKRK